MSNVSINLSRFSPRLDHGTLYLDVPTIPAHAILRAEALEGHSPADAEMISHAIAATFNRINVALLVANGMEDVKPLGY